MYTHPIHVYIPSKFLETSPPSTSKKFLFGGRARLHEAAHGREERHGGHEARERGGHEAEEPTRKALEEALLEVASAGERPDLKISFDTTEIWP